jgi:hypothetical protein
MPSTSELFAEDAVKAAKDLGLKPPIKVDASHMFADGGTLGILFTDSDNKEMKLCYDGRQDKRLKDRDHKYHIFLGGLYPSDEGAVEIPICSAKEKAILQIVVDWVDKNYPQDWRDNKKWASTGYIKRMIDDLTNRVCK